MHSEIFLANSRVFVVAFFDFWETSFTLAVLFILFLADLLLNAPFAACASRNLSSERLPKKATLRTGLF